MSIHSYYYNDLAVMVNELDKMMEILDNIKSKDDVESLKNSVQSVRYVLSNLSIQRMRLMA